MSPGCTLGTSSERPAWVCLSLFPFSRHHISQIYFLPLPLPPMSGSLSTETHFYVSVFVLVLCLLPSLPISSCPSFSDKVSLTLGSIWDKIKNIFSR